MKLPRIVTWETTRSFAGLHLLNRTSMIVVIAVPIIAAVWPAVPYGVAAFNGTLGIIERNSNQAHETVQEVTPLVTANALVSQQSMARIDTALTQIGDQVGHLDRTRGESTAGAVTNAEIFL